VGMLRLFVRAVVLDGSFSCHMDAPSSVQGAA